MPLTLSGTNGVSGIDGTSSNPALKGGTSTTAGVVYPAADTVAISTASTERARVSSDGTFRVKGAGTAGSTDALQISGSAPASAMILDSSGNLGLGTTSPTAINGTVLHIEGTSTSQPAFRLSRQTESGYGYLSVAGEVNLVASSKNLGLYATGAYNISFTTNGTSRANIDSSGNFKVSNLAGTGNRAVYSDANGNLTNSSSDETLKTNIVDITYGLNSVIALRPVSYNWKDTEKRGEQNEIGFIAQEVSVIVPEVIGFNFDETLSLDYPKLTAVLTKAIQELSAKLDAAEARIAALEAK